MKYWRIIKFFEKMIFPHLCYGCSAPGQLLCLQCLREVQRVRSCERCWHCFRLLKNTEKKHCCQCLPSFSHRSRSLFFRSSVTQAIYQNMSFEKTQALRFFVREINKILLLDGRKPHQIIYEPTLKTLATLLTHTQSAANRPISLSKWRKHHQSFRSSCSICILSVYPLKEDLRFYIEQKIKTPSILISLFLQDRHL